MITDFVLHGCVEYEDLFSLINTVNKLKESTDNIIVVLDSLTTSNEMIEMVHTFNIEPVLYPHHNWQDKFEFEKTLWKHDLIFELDADEIPPYLLFKVFKEPFITHVDLEVLAVPRINLYIDATPEKVANMYVGNRPQNILLEQQASHQLGWVNWPDYQIRIHRPLSHLKWGDTTHSGISNYNTYDALPMEPAIALIHAKTVAHMERMLKCYDKLGF